MASLQDFMVVVRHFTYKTAWCKEHIHQNAHDIGTEPCDHKSNPWLWVLSFHTISDPSHKILLTPSSTMSQVLPFITACIDP